MSLNAYENAKINALASVSETLSNQSEALQNLHQQFESSKFSQNQLFTSLDILYDTIIGCNGKIVVSGIGKSYKIATKLVATLNSLSIQSYILHPSEALHGDLGVLRENDCLLLLTASGNTPELIQLLPHVSKKIPIILLTCSKDSKLSNNPQVKSLLYAELPAHLKEDNIHGIPAPTVSTTLSLALADATILALSEMIENDLLKRKIMFAKSHPGGSIGSDLSHLNDNLINSKSENSSIIVNNDLHSNQNNKRSFSSQVSSSSLLSLNNMRSIFQTDSKTNKLSKNDSLNSSVTSSDDDEDTISCLQQKIKPFDTKLSNKIKNCESYKILKISYDSFLNISEFDLFKSIALYDYITIPKNNLVLAHESNSIRNSFKLEIGNGYTPEVWSLFISNLTNDFKPVHI